MFHLSVAYLMSIPCSPQLLFCCTLIQICFFCFCTQREKPVGSLWFECLSLVLSCSFWLCSLHIEWNMAFVLYENWSWWLLHLLQFWIDYEHIPNEILLYVYCYHCSVSHAWVSVMDSSVRYKHQRTILFSLLFLTNALDQLSVFTGLILVKLSNVTCSYFFQEILYNSVVILNRKVANSPDSCMWTLAYTCQASLRQGISIHKPQKVVTQLLKR